VIAPDLERYLDPANVDLMVTDQVQAVRVRVARGLEVFENRLGDALIAVRRWLIAGAAMLLFFAVIGSMAAHVGWWLSACGAAAGALWTLWILSRAGLDQRRLRRLSSRFSRLELDGLETSREVLDYGEAILAEARALGASEPHFSPP
jgi:hypothetical protein